MRLYHAPASPFARKVLVLLHECGQAGAVTLVPAAGNPVDPQTMPVAVNPLGKIPCLVPDDGPALYDSRVICRWLDVRFGAGMYPDPPRLWDTLVVEATADGIMEAAVALRYETHVRAPAERSADWQAAWWAKIARALDAIGDRWAGHLAGPFDMGQAAVACALDYLDYRHGARDWRAGRPLVADWAASVAARPSVAATVPPPA